MLGNECFEHPDTNQSYLRILLSEWKVFFLWNLSRLERASCENRFFFIYLWVWSRLQKISSWEFFFFWNYWSDLSSIFLNFSILYDPLNCLSGLYIICLCFQFLLWNIFRCRNFGWHWWLHRFARLRESFWLEESLFIVSSQYLLWIYGRELVLSSLWTFLGFM